MCDFKAKEPILNEKIAFLQVILFAIWSGEKYKAIPGQLRPRAPQPLPAQDNPAWKETALSAALDIIIDRNLESGFNYI